MTLEEIEVRIREVIPSAEEITVSECWQTSPGGLAFHVWSAFVRLPGFRKPIYQVGRDPDGLVLAIHSAYATWMARTYDGGGERSGAVRNLLDETR